MFKAFLSFSYSFFVKCCPVFRLYFSFFSGKHPCSLQGCFLYFNKGGDVVANNENLVSLADRTTAEKRAIATKGGVASGKARREKKTLRAAVEAVLNSKDADGVDGWAKVGAAIVAGSTDGNPAMVDKLITLLGENKQALDLTVSKTSAEAAAEFVELLKDE